MTQSQKPEKVHAVYCQRKGSRWSHLTLLIPLADFSVVLSETHDVFCYQTCTAEKVHGYKTDKFVLSNPTDLGPRVYLGSVVTLEQLENDYSWEDARHPKHRNRGDRLWLIKSLKDAKSLAGVVLRDGAFVPLLSGETVEPIEWVPSGITIEHHPSEEENHDF